MFRLIVVIVVCFVASLACAQGSPVSVGVELLPQWQRTAVNFKDGQLDLIDKAWQFNVATLAVSPGRWRAKYTLLPGVGFEETVVNPQKLVIGSTDFGSSDSTQKTSQQKQTAVSMSHKIPIGHRFEFAPDWRVRPIVVGEMAGVSFEAIGEKDGKAITETEAYKRFCVGAGGAWSYISPLTRIDCTVAFGDRYQFAQAMVMRRFYRDMSIGLGYEHKIVRFPNDIAVKQDGGFGFLSAAF
jgi:hypothetical protein